MTKHF